MIQIFFSINKLILEKGLLNKFCRAYILNLPSPPLLVVMYSKCHHLKVLVVIVSTVSTF